MVDIASDAVDLRRGIDHIGVCVVFIVHDGTGRVLMQKRGPKARDENGAWDIGGGAVEFGESIDEAVRRELDEELGTSALDIDFLSVYDAHREHNGDKTHWVALLHAVKINPEDAQIGEPEKVEKLEWFTADSLPSPLHSQLPKAMDIAVAQGIVK